MAIRGFSINLTRQLSGKQATAFAQWIGASNVIRNQKIVEYKSLLADGNGNQIGQGYSHLKNAPELSFLTAIPVQLLRNAASMVFSDVEASRKGLRKFPKIKGHHKKRSVLVTRELTLVEPLGDDLCLLTFFDNATKKRQKLFTIKLPYSPTRLAKQFRISRQGARFTLSGSYYVETDSDSNESLLSDYAHLDDDALLAIITGIDRGIRLQIQTSDSLTITYSSQQTNQLKALAAKKAHYQRILARKKRCNNNKNKHKCETKNQKKLASKIAKLDNKAGDIRKNFCHHASKQVVVAAKPIISLEALKLKNMTRRAKPTRDKSGRKFVKNNARAKSGLNRNLLNVALGRIGDLVKYKALDCGKAVVEVNPAYTSKTCHVCGSRNTERPDQATFICNEGCGTYNADFNAAIVIAQRAVTYIKENKFADKAKSHKIIARRRKRAASPPLVRERTSVKKSGEFEVALTGSP